MPDASRCNPGPAVLAFAALILFALPVPAAEWNGTEASIDGELHIRNPAEAINPRMEIELEEEFRLGGWDGGEHEFFGVIIDIEEDSEGNIYALDYQLDTIRIYGPDGTYLNSIGHAGEGPGEFRGATAMFWFPDGRLGVVQPIPERVVTLYTDGTPGDDFRLEDLAPGEFRFMRDAGRTGENLAVIYGLNNFDDEAQTFERTLVLALVDVSGTEIRQLLTHDSNISFVHPKMTELGFDNFAKRWTIGGDGRIYAPPRISDYSIRIWTADGELDRVIEREYPDHRRTRKEKADLEDHYERLNRGAGLPPNTIYEAERNFPCINWGGIQTRPDGSIWVSTSRGVAGGDPTSLGTFDVYDPKGRFVRQVELGGQCNNEADAMFFVGERIIVVTEFVNAKFNAIGSGKDEDDRDGEEAEPMTLISYGSDRLDAAAGISRGAGGL